jgi:ribosomal protein L37AE/L43A
MTMVPGTPRTRDWFVDDELQECPRCRERAALTTDRGVVICTECGVVGFRLTPARAVAEDPAADRGTAS